MNVNTLLRMHTARNFELGEHGMNMTVNPKIPAIVSCGGVNRKSYHLNNGS